MAILVVSEPTIKSRMTCLVFTLYEETEAKNEPLGLLTVTAGFLGGKKASAGKLFPLQEILKVQISEDVLLLLLSTAFTCQVCAPQAKRPLIFNEVVELLILS